MTSQGEEGTLDFHFSTMASFGLICFLLPTTSPPPASRNTASAANTCVASFYVSPIFLWHLVVDEHGLGRLTREAGSSLSDPRNAFILALVTLVAMVLVVPLVDKLVLPWLLERRLHIARRWPAAPRNDPEAATNNEDSPTRDFVDAIRLSTLEATPGSRFSDYELPQIPPLAHFDSILEAMPPQAMPVTHLPRMIVPVNDRKVAPAISPTYIPFAAPSHTPSASPAHTPTYAPAHDPDGGPQAMPVANHSRAIIPVDKEEAAFAQE